MSKDKDSYLNTDIYIDWFFRKAKNIAYEIGDVKLIDALEEVENKCQRCFYHDKIVAICKFCLQLIEDIELVIEPSIKEALKHREIILSNQDIYYKLRNVAKKKADLVAVSRQKQVIGYEVKTYTDSFVRQLRKYLDAYDKVFLILPWSFPIDKLDLISPMAIVKKAIEKLNRRKQNNEQTNN